MYTLNEGMADFLVLLGSNAQSGRMDFETKYMYTDIDVNVIYIYYKVTLYAVYSMFTSLASLHKASVFERGGLPVQMFTRPQIY